MQFTFKLFPSKGINIKRDKEKREGKKEGRKVGGRKDKRENDK